MLAGEVALMVARLVMDVVDGTATAGSTTSLTDLTNLSQADDYWNGGTVFVKSGTHAGKLLTVTDFASGVVTFASLGATAIAANDKFAIARGHYPHAQILAAMDHALADTHVEAVDDSLTGDGTTLDFTLPAGVYDIKRVEFLRDSVERLMSSHWREVNGVLRYDYGYEPVDGDEIHITYRKAHDAVTAYSTAISTEIMTDWLRYAAAEKLLWWGVGMYGRLPEFRIEERMNFVMEKLKKLRARALPDVMLWSA